MSFTVLVLNANFEPINTCGLQRAMGLILTDKAILIQNGRGELRSVSQVFPIPSVIRLQRMVHRPRPRVKLTRREVFRRDHYSCQYCGKKGGVLTIDHIIPRRLGGKQTWQNVVTACSTCNHRKGGRMLKDSNMCLLKPVRKPSGSAIYIFGRHLSENAGWEPFLQGW
jgi:5-methylcytosine-specific restriction endonuclease McrA